MFFLAQRELATPLIATPRLDARTPNDSHPRMLYHACITPLAALTLLTFTACGPSAPLGTMPVTVGGKTFECRISATEATREQGFGGVSSLSSTEGMIFAFSGAATHNFWMRRCVMDLDIAFIDPLGFVTAVHTMPKEELQREGETEDEYLARLKRYPSLAPAQFVLEVAPGTLAPLGVRRGSRVEFDRAALKMLAE